MSLLGKDYVYKHPIRAAFVIFFCVEMTYFLLLDRKRYTNLLHDDPLLFVGALFLKLLVYVGVAYLIREFRVTIKRRGKQ